MRLISVISYLSARPGVFLCLRLFFPLMCVKSTCQSLIQVVSRIYFFLVLYFFFLMFATLTFVFMIPFSSVGSFLRVYVLVCFPLKRSCFALPALVPLLPALISLISITWSLLTCPPPPHPHPHPLLWLLHFLVCPCAFSFQPLFVFLHMIFSNNYFSFFFFSPLLIIFLLLGSRSSTPSVSGTNCHSALMNY